MSQETTHPIQEPEPAELVGLTPDQQERAAELTQRVADRTDQLRHTRNTAYGSTHTGMLSGNTVSGPSVMSVWTGDIATGIKEAQLKFAKFAAKRHYKKHQAEYQVQAYKDATAAGVEVDRPTERAQHSPKRRLGNLALAGADVATTAAAVSTLVTPVGVKDIIPAYLAYRFGKGAVVRGATAIKGHGDPSMALSTKNPRRIPLSVHGSKKQLRDRREANKAWARINAMSQPQ